LLKVESWLGNAILSQEGVQLKSGKRRLLMNLETSFVSVE